MELEDLKFAKYPKIHLVGYEENKDIFSDPADAIVIEEKVDGANFRFMLKNGKILFGSRSNSLGYEDAVIGGNWKRCVEFIKRALSLVDKRDLVVNEAIFYGECMVQHSVAYDWDLVPPFLGFDIWSFRAQRFLGYAEKKYIFDQLQLPMVPLIRICSALELTKIDDGLVPKSAYCAGPAEGIVFKNYRKQLFAKYVTTKFKEVNKAVFGGGKKFARTDDERIVAMYCTNARVDKIIFKLLAEGEQLRLELMHKLPKRVIEDILEENWREICWSSWSVNFKDVRARINKRCFETLKQVIVNDALQNRKD